MQKDSVPALLGMAQACVLLKQIPKARTQLKRLAKAPWTLAEAEDLEKSWLLLANIYSQGGKFDLASELLRRCIQYNKVRWHPGSRWWGGDTGLGRFKTARRVPWLREQRRCGVETGQDQDWNWEHR